MNNLLLVEDEWDLVYAMQKFLKEEGYGVISAETYEKALEEINQNHFDICLIDINLPDGNGNSLINVIKTKEKDVGVIIVSANNLTEDKIQSLNFGADDYMTKPFNLQELNARIRSVMRRKNKLTSHQIQSGSITLFPNEYKTFINGADIQLTRKEFELLLYFVTNQGHLITKEALASHLWGIHLHDYDNYDFIYAHVKNLRKKLVQAGVPDRIKNTHGIGYVFATE